MPGPQICRLSIKVPQFMQVLTKKYIKFGQGERNHILPPKLATKIVFLHSKRNLT